MHIKPILATLRCHKLTAVLLALQVAVTCAIVSNAVFLIAQRVERITVPSGLDEDSLSIVTFNDLGVDANALSLHKADVAALRRLPGVESVALVNNVPFSRSQHSSGGCISLEAIQAVKKAHSIKVPGCASADVYSGGPGTLQTFGLDLIAGRDFHAGEYLASQADAPVDAPAIIVTRAFARRLFPEHPNQVLGRRVYFGGSGIVHGHATPIVGVVAQLHRGRSYDDGTGGASVLLPILPNQANVRLALRSDPADRDQIMREALATLGQRRPTRQLSADNAQTYAQMRSEYFQRDATMMHLLLAATLALLFVTALGIGGLASFWVGQRSRAIGIRRAVGATRGEILRYFQTENLLIVSSGVALGALFGIGLNLLLMQHYELSRLPLGYLVVGAVLLWLLGQLAVLQPALRAANVPPVVATRSV